MPSPPPLNPRVRRLLLQVVLIGLLGGTLAVAAWVRNTRLMPPAVELSQPINLHYVTAKLPVGWATRSGSQGFLGYAAVAEEAQDPYGESPGRELEVKVERLLFGGAKAEKYLEETFHASTAGATPTTVGGQPGVLVQVRDPQVGGELGVPVVHVYACAILPQRYAVTVHLQITGRRPNPWDLKLLSQVAEAIGVAAESKPAPAAGAKRPATAPADDEN